MTGPIALRAYLHVVTGAGERHPIAGDSVRLVAFLYDTISRRRLEIGAGTMRCSIIRYNFKQSRLEFLNSDKEDTDACWCLWEASAPVKLFDMSVAEGDNRLFQKDFLYTMGWGSSDVRVGVEVEVDGVYYTTNCVREFVGPYHRHDGMIRSRNGA